MDQWEQWFKEFMKNWFDALAESLSRLERPSREQFESAFSEFDEKMIEGFSEAWRELGKSDQVKRQVANSLDAIKEPSQEQMSFLRNWLEILMNTIEQQDESTRRELLSTCGAACAGHATESFMKIWKKSDNLRDFLDNMNAEMCDGGNFYHYVDENTIEIAYPKCLCPIVGFDLISSPMLCDCSRAWLKTNMEAALEKPVDVQRIYTALEGKKSCSFKITLT
jgi:hypothetical protein